MSATPRTLTPSISPLGQRKWKTFIDNKELSCYSFHLAHTNNPSATTNTTTTATATDADNNDENDSPAFTPSQLDEWFRKLHPSNYQNNNYNDVIGSALSWTNATYKNQILLRKTAWHTFDEECTCEYGYSDTWQPLIQNQKMKDVLREITGVVQKVIGASGDGGNVSGEGLLNSVNLNYYPQGGGVGFHADDEFLFNGLNQETRIVSLSLCSKNTTAAGGGDDEDDNFGARKFQVKQKGKEYESQINEILLRHGDIMTMEGMFQKHYLHSVWPGDSKKYRDDALCRGERINLTWRTIVRHLDGSRECKGLKCPLSSQDG